MSTAIADRRSPLFYARLAGTIYLLAMALGIFSQAYILGRIVGDDASGTAQQIAASEGLFRLGLVIDVLTAVTDVIIAWALYELLKSVDASLALVGAWLRIADAALLAMTAVSGLVTLRLLSGVGYLQSFEPGQLQSLARLYVSVRSSGFYVGFVFLGLGSAVFAWLLFRSRYVPRVLAGWGIFASVLLAIGSLGVMLSPAFASSGAMIYMLPMFFYEVPLGLWFLIRGVSVNGGIRESEPSEQRAAW